MVDHGPKQKRRCTHGYMRWHNRKKTLCSSMFDLLKGVSDLNQCFSVCLINRGLKNR